MDFPTLARRVYDIRSQYQADPAQGLKLEYQFYIDVLRAISKKDIGSMSPDDAALFALIPATIEYERWPE